jgi:AcrR family transcriptional regulator
VATALFRSRGYHGTPVRALASNLKMEAGSLYYHFPSKQQLLFDGFEQTMDELLAGLRDAVERESTAPRRLCAAVRFHVRYHTEHQSEAFVSHTEIRALTGRNRAAILEKRDEYEAMFRALIDAGVATGEFDVPDTGLTNIAILTMCSGVADWFSPKGRLDGAAVADRYAELVLRMVRYSGAAGRARGTRAR